MGGNYNNTFEGKAYGGGGTYGFGQALAGIAATHLSQDEVRTDKLHEVIARIFKEDIVRDITHLTDEERKCLEASIQTSCEDYNKHIYEKEDAIKDTDTAIKTIFDEYEDQLLPSILGRQCNLGIYNDTSTQLLINDAYSSTVVKAGTLRLDSIHRYVGHIGTLAKILHDGLQLGIQDLTHDITDRDIDENIKKDNTGTQENEMERSLNMTDFVKDMLILVAVQAILDKLIKGGAETGDA